MYTFVEALRYSQKNNGERMTSDWLENHFFYVTPYGTFLNSMASKPDVEVFASIVREGKVYYPMSQRAAIQKKQVEKSRASKWAASVLKQDDKKENESAANAAKSKTNWF